MAVDRLRVAVRSSFARAARRAWGGWRRGGDLLRRAVMAGLPPGWGEGIALEALRADGRRTSPSSIELAYRVNHALRTLPDAEGANRWLHHRWHGWFETMSALDRSRLLARYRSYDDADLLCTSAVVVARKRSA